MTLHQWWTHFRGWLFMFPWWNDDTHCYTSVVGDPGPETCLLCGATKEKTPEDHAWEAGYMQSKRYKAWEEAENGPEAVPEYDLDA